MLDEYVVSGKHSVKAEDKGRWLECCNFIFIVLAVNLEGREDGIFWSVLGSRILHNIAVLQAGK